MSFIIRQAVGHDYEATNQLFAEIERFHGDLLPHIFRPPNTPARNPTSFDKLLTRQRLGFFVAENEAKQLIGLVVVSLRETHPTHPFVRRRYAWIDDLVVTASARRMGVGQALMEAAQAWAIGKGITDMELQVWHNEAAEFYNQLGYQTLNQTMWKTLVDGD